MNSNILKNVFASTVSISDLTRAGANKIFDSLKDDKFIIVLKNNKPIATLLSTDRYQELLDSEENLLLIQKSLARMAKNEGTISREDFFRDNGITDDYLDKLDDIDME